MSRPPATATALRAQHRAETLALRLPPLLVAAERVAATVAQGVHGRRRVGTGESFWQFRRYQPGDSAQMIDWRQSAKNRHVFVRENEWEAAQSVWIWRDDSASMDWRSDRDLPTKRERADLLALALAVLLVRGGERVALLGSGVAPSAARSILPRLALHLTGPAAAAGGRDTGSDAGRDGDGVPPVEALPRHARIVLVGDLLGPLERVQATVAAYANRGLRGHLVQVLDPAEETLPFGGRVEFTGLEGEAELLVPRVEGIRDAYLERLAAQKTGLSDLARAAGWSYSVHCTDRPAQVPLLSLWGALAQEAV
ncbi:DUF58 domain-containing protein [Rhodospirillum centenum]|uniref:DUF58 domain-containing protein n=1 Tax=Rhodospirillum centenum (strain ATCC 51521 / SW) TaxID=414684 RepID=B6IWU8_RHOCS|nr:DUF58 domain-containing protein [Rhodospirillum centenum]ACJ00772.1 conserved hypothetical protein [Rhodospirillum centenum SW]